MSFHPPIPRPKKHKKGQPALTAIQKPGPVPPGKTPPKPSAPSCH